MDGIKLRALFDQYIISHINYNLIDIVIDYYETIKSAHIALILKTEKDKEIFLLENYKKCIIELSEVINESKIIEINSFDYSVFSKEEIDQKYEGNYYYAIR